MQQQKTLLTPKLEVIATAYRDDIAEIIAGKEMTDGLYEALYLYYLDSGLMPYNVAKARGGDPYTWVFKAFQVDFGLDLFNGY